MYGLYLKLFVNLFAETINIERAMQVMLDIDIWTIAFFQQQCETIQLDDRSGNLFEDRHEDDADYVTTEHDNIRDDYE